MTNSYLDLKCKCGCTNFYLHEDTKSGMHIGIYCKKCQARQMGRWVSQKTTIDNPVSEVDKISKCKNIEDLRGKSLDNTLQEKISIKKDGNIIYLRKEA